MSRPEEINLKVTQNYSLFLINSMPFPGMKQEKLLLQTAL